MVILTKKRVTTSVVTDFNDFGDKTQTKIYNKVIHAFSSSLKVKCAIMLKSVKFWVILSLLVHSKPG